jgi:hypothetical protein
MSRNTGIVPAPGASDNTRAQNRFALSNAWRTYSSTDPNRARKIGGFRLVNNAGDALSRVNYSCGGPNMITSSPRVLHMTMRDGGQSTAQCDGTGVAPSTCNVKYVYDSSDFIRYKRQNAINNGLPRHESAVDNFNNPRFTVLTASPPIAVEIIGAFTPIVLEKIVRRFGPTYRNPTSMKLGTAVTALDPLLFDAARKQPGGIRLTELTHQPSDDHVLATIPDSFLDGATQLKSVVLPHSVTAINRSAFKDAQQLTALTFTKATTKPAKFVEIKSQAFNNSPLMAQLPVGVANINTSGTVTPDNNPFSRCLWGQRGADLTGESPEDRFGWSVSMNQDGTVVAVGALQNSGNGIAAGHARVYEWNDTAWVRRGADIDGEAAGNLSGFMVSLSSNGTVLAVSAPYNGGGTGQIRVYKYRQFTHADSVNDVYHYSSRVQNNTTQPKPLIITENTATPPVINNFYWMQLGSDIDGDPSNILGERLQLSLSHDGRVVAVGAKGAQGGVRIYEWNNTAWVPRGTTIHGETATNTAGYIVSLNNTGTIIAIGEVVNNQNSGHVRVYEYREFTQADSDNDTYHYASRVQNTTTQPKPLIITPDLSTAPTVGNFYWSQLGRDIDGVTTGEFSGSAISLSNDGAVLAVGAASNSTAGLNAGQVRVYSWTGTAWSQRGRSIDGGEAGEFSGYAVSLNTDGTVLAAGAPDYSGSGDNFGRGRVRVYDWNGSVWVRCGIDINIDLEGAAPGDSSGVTISLSDNGRVIAIGAPNNSGNGADSGHVRVWSHHNSAAQPTFFNLVFDANVDSVRRRDFENATTQLSNIMNNNPPPGFVPITINVSTPILAANIGGRARITSFQTINGRRYTRSGFIQLNGIDSTTPYSTILHEICHILGISGTMWGIFFGSINDDNIYLTQYSNSNGGLYYIGEHAVREYKSYLTQNTNIVGIPMENDGGSGTANSHPEEGSLNSFSENNRIVNAVLHPGLHDELMTGVLTGGSQPVSRITLGFLEDLGYDIDYSQAQNYEITAAQQTIDFTNTIFNGATRDNTVAAALLPDAATFTQWVNGFDPSEIAPTIRCSVGDILTISALFIPPNVLIISEDASTTDNPVDSPAATPPRLTSPGDMVWRPEREGIYYYKSTTIPSMQGEIIVSFPHSFFLFPNTVYEPNGSPTAWLDADNNPNPTLSARLGEPIKFIVSGSVDHPFVISTDDSSTPNPVATPPITPSPVTNVNIFIWRPTQLRTYHYKCTNHNVMRGLIEITLPNDAVPTELLVRFDNATSNYTLTNIDDVPIPINPDTSGNVNKLQRDNIYTFTTPVALAGNVFHLSYNDTTNTMVKITSPIESAADASVTFFIPDTTTINIVNSNTNAVINTITIEQ